MDQTLTNGWIKLDQTLTNGWIKLDQTLTNGKELVFQPTVLRLAASATGFLQNYLEFQ
jgi:hypothetical protein